VGKLIEICGYEEVSLLSLSTSDYPGIERLVATLGQRYKGKKLTISLPSLRLDTFSVSLADSLEGQRKSSLTFAPEAGTERLRQVINKGAAEDDLLQAIAAAVARGWRGFKLYFMLGLPTETMEDVEAIVGLVGKIRKLGPRIKVSASTFIPKPHTPFQWLAQATTEELEPKHQALRRGLKRLGVTLSWQDPKMSLIEGLLSRGDRRLGQVIQRAFELGSTFDAWSEHFDYKTWLRAFDEIGLDPHFYAHRERPMDELFPWSHIDPGVSLDFLKREYERAINKQETPDCRYSPCAACGLQRWDRGCQQRYQHSRSIP
jgi:radical SAM superfamily enzyme YgiQ (UPF0313 family)